MVFLVVAIDSRSTALSNSYPFAVFLQEPGTGPLQIAPLETQVQLSCSVSEGYKIATWSILLPNNNVPLGTEVPALRDALSDMGIVAREAASGRESLLLINGTEENNGTSVTCIAMDVSSATSRHMSREIRVIFYGKSRSCDCHKLNVILSI